MPTRNATNMDPAAIVAEITQLRSSIDVSSRRIHELSRTLYDRMRRVPYGTPDPNQDVYVTYANTWTRFAGMIQQGLQRTRHSDRLLRMIENEPKEEVRPGRPAPEDVPQGSHPEPVNIGQAHSMPADSPLRDFIEVYGEEMVRDADGTRQR